MKSDKPAHPVAEREIKTNNDSLKKTFIVFPLFVLFVLIPEFSAREQQFSFWYFLKHRDAHADDSDSNADVNTEDAIPTAVTVNRVPSSMMPQSAINI